MRTTDKSTTAATRPRTIMRQASAGSGLRLDPTLTQLAVNISARQAQN